MMYGKIEAMGSKLLGMFVPKVDAAALSCNTSSWSACWQCNYNVNPDGKCSYNAPCHGTVCSDGTYNLICSC
jgi:hypothetical protein